MLLSAALLLPSLVRIPYGLRTLTPHTIPCLNDLLYLALRTLRFKDLNAAYYTLSAALRGAAAAAATGPHTLMCSAAYLKRMFNIPQRMFNVRSVPERRTRRLSQCY